MKINMAEENNIQLSEEESKKIERFSRILNKGLRELLGDNRSGNGAETAAYFYGGSMRFVNELYDREV